ncbi:LLM class flavin-dependent oxidoreductase [Roseomonas sp. CAU 1739]|uniref:LLM class flavin-dependent oxidoreductase n=1 Tax=Roseomonas sp. CAU 1739 TaxID=3140364 RepID=UPI00325C0792
MGKRTNMTLVGFLQAQNCSNLPGSWRHPEAIPDFLTADHYVRIARTLEEGKFHLAFFDDRLAMPDIYGDDYRTAVKYGIRSVKMDLIPLLTAMGMATRHIGLGGTYSTTYYEPFHVARTFQTLDLMVGGRAAWNVVTSLNDSEALNMGAAGHLPHDMRYDRADEFIECVLGHWNSWEDDALEVDRRPGGIFADPDKVHRLNYEGKYFRSRGPFTVPRSPQGHPLVIQAGQSGRGKTFAARWGELIFASYKSLTSAQAQYRELKSAIAAAGRNPDHVHIAPPIYAVVGETRSIAKEKEAFLASLAQPEDALCLLGEILNFDFAGRDLDAPMTDADMRAMTGQQALRDRVAQAAGTPHPTTRDFIDLSKRGTLYEMPVFCGTASDVADEMEAWFQGEGCDGFVVAATHRPGSYEDFTRYVVPELQRRGVFHTEYRGTTLRENMGLPRPVAHGVPKRTI